MDPLTHTFVGAALAGAGLRRRTRGATAALILGANAPDIDIAAYIDGPYAALAFRRGWTHGPLALVALPFVVTGIILAYYRLASGDREPAAAAPRAGPLLLAAFLGVLTHAPLDWLNTYGVRWLMPFSDRWFYGDALFIVDPWVWLLLGGAVFLTGRARDWTDLAAWGGLAALTTAPILAVPFLPAASKIAWSAGILLLVAVRARGSARWADGRKEWAVRGAVALAALYIAGMIGLSRAAERDARSAFAGAARPVGEVMYQPDPASPLTSTLVGVAAENYLQGGFDWRSARRVQVRASIPRGPAGGPIAAAARRHRDAHDYLVWSRFPIYQVRSAEGGGLEVRIGDARFVEGPGGGSLAGVTVRLDEGLEPVAR